ncbi:hypothetical protein SCHPADRAFT_944227 [Schizopora paradoxa]|uniref:F-box domain-containing protein n=1 Tax=Schizopora paradoxa TaxID=27342 RepID=A0A0H2RA74_9AGAM|nr:hypothetical protein SCHPADRAFT_944227 [Schizopora paradoxa]
MKTVSRLPDEILCNIFFLAIQNWRVLPKIFKSKNDFNECVALIDISQVCRRWRDVALANPTLWSSLHIDLLDPSSKTLRKVAYFAEVCFARSRDLPLICAISISHLDNFRLAHPLLLALVVHEARWSQIAINLTRPRRQVTPFPVFPEMVRDTSGDYDIHLNNAGAGLLKEFQLNLQSWFSFSMTNPFQRLATLRIAHSDLLVLDDAQGTIAKWLPLASNLTELEITKDDSRVSFAAVQHKVRLESKPRLFRPPVLLPKLRVLLASPTLLPKLTCPALEKYILNYLPPSKTFSTSWNAVNPRCAPLKSETGRHGMNLSEGFSYEGSPPSQSSAQEKISSKYFRSLPKG